MDLCGKVALVTGAGRRLGRAIAVELARAGADIALHYNRSGDEAREAAAEIASIKRKPMIREVGGIHVCRRFSHVGLFQADLADPAQIAAMFADVDAAFGRLDVLVNSASVYHATPLATLTAELWDAEFAVNARAAALCIHHAAPLMAAGGAIVNIADIAAEKARPSFPAYCASKGALLALSKSAAKALAPNITVNCVSPGVALWSDGASEDYRQAVLAQVPMKRPGSPQDIAAAVVFLAQQDYITGQNLRVDGGWHMG